MNHPLVALPSAAQCEGQTRPYRAALWCERADVTEPASALMPAGAYGPTAAGQYPPILLPDMLLSATHQFRP
jgi:hypothetical protein